jgi:hypothetical protein
LLINFLTLSIYQRTFPGEPEQSRTTESNRSRLPHLVTCHP